MSGSEPRDVRASRDDIEEARASRFIQEFNEALVRELGLESAITQGFRYDAVSRGVRLYAVIPNGCDGDTAEVTVERAGFLSMEESQDIFDYLIWVLRDTCTWEVITARMRHAELLEEA